MSDSEYQDADLMEEENSEERSNIIQEVKTGKISSIYKCKKPELIQILREERLESNEPHTVDQLRKQLSDHFKNKGKHQQKACTSTMTALGELKPFDGEKWEVFEQQFECFILVNDITEDKKVPLLITKLTAKVFETLTYLCSPKQPKTFTYQDLIKKLQDKYVKTLSTTLERAEFRKRNQLPNEKIQDYALELRKLAGKCNFKDIDDQIKEKFMEGVSSKLIKFELMKSPAEITLEKCIELARTVEAALLHTKNSGEVTEIFYNRGKSKPTYKTKRTDNNNKPGAQCYCCGKNNHLKAECTLKKKYCSECGVQGHVYRMCPKKTRQVNVLESNTSAGNEDNEDVENSVQDLFEGYTTYTVNSMQNN
ncbi:uncharacterized protein LOC134658828 [Cydia amplana]|uniref:uncharacterized protein LOC134658828 n=1 Tax=Cydia amplana TaxID=1869771 RepID=UPI002FE50733